MGTFGFVTLILRDPPMGEIVESICHMYCFGDPPRFLQRGRNWILGKILLEIKNMSIIH